MTKYEAIAFLDRNPKIAERLKTIRPDPEVFEHLYWYGDAANERDANVNLVSVVLALGKDWWEDRNS